ncbi:hypothetical protein AMTRI_Chr03g51500 [Amborella trichopoda]
MIEVYNTSRNASYRLYFIVYINPYILLSTIHLSIFGYMLCSVVIRTCFLYGLVTVPFACKVEATFICFDLSFKPFLIYFSLSLSNNVFIRKTCKLQTFRNCYLIGEDPLVESILDDSFIDIILCLK